jgi:hypothetical protein
MVTRLEERFQTTMMTQEPQGPSDRGDHHTPESHWYGSCRAWVVDCDHLVGALPIKHVSTDDGWIRSLSSDRRTRRLEIEFTWNDVRQFWPIPLDLFRELWRGRPMYIVPHQKMLPNRRMRWAFVRTEGKVMVSLLKGLALISPEN